MSIQDRRVRTKSSELKMYEYVYIIKIIIKTTKSMSVNVCCGISACGAEIIN